MRDLIERLERATGPDRELDARIWSAVNGQPLYEYNTPEYGHLQAFIGGWRDDRGRTIASPAYTASLDAALTLVPEGCYVDLQTRRRYCSVSSWDDRDYGMPLGTTIGASTPALALCIAALKAREAAK